MKHARINAIDGLRAIAMTMVVAFHCNLFPVGWMGVWLFFVISGYVISRNFLQREYVNLTPALQYGSFMRRRFFRIVPIYFAYLVVGIVVLRLVDKPDLLNGLPYLLTFTYNWGQISEFARGIDVWDAFGHLWTLSVEEQFYLFYPLIFLFLPRKAYTSLIIALVAAGPIVRLVYSLWLSNFTDISGWNAYFAVYAASFAQFDAFLTGCLVANFEDDILKRPWFAYALFGFAVAAAAAYVFVYWMIDKGQIAEAGGHVHLTAIIGTGIYGQFREVFIYSVVDLLSVAVLIFAILKKPFTHPLAWGPIALVGRISYGGYLFHAFIIWLIGFAVAGDVVRNLPLVDRVMWFFAAWLATVAIAYCSFTWFEKPVMDWSRRKETETVRYAS
jgi:peptidoglycan/LPS O-acetylase OafA/YrhL